MRQSKLFTKTRKEAPSDEVSKNAQLLIRAGYIHKHMAGVYEMLPLGYRVIKKIEQVIREEMDAIGSQEMQLTTLQSPESWKKSGRWDDEVVDNWFKTELKNGTVLGVANTHEEPLTNILKEYVDSYKDLPAYVYQFQTKFRNELRAKSGIMRVREFFMKDLYSFSRTEEEHKEFYERCAEAYLEIFKRVGIGDMTYRTIADGGSFTDGLTDEFQTITDAGEDVIYVDESKNIAINKEVYKDENLERFGLDKDSLVEKKAVEVGNIFPLGTKYSDALDWKFTDQDGNKKSVIMGSYGIGLGRLFGTIAEVLADEKGLVWPESVAPFRVHVLALPGGEEKAEELYNELQKRSIEVLFDDRDKGAGEKFADADLMGIPYRIIVSEKSLASGGVEVTRRDEEESKILSIDELFDLLT